MTSGHSAFTTLSYTAIVTSAGLDLSGVGVSIPSLQVRLLLTLVARGEFFHMKAWRKLTARLISLFLPFSRFGNLEALSPVESRGKDDKAGEAKISLKLIAFDHFILLITRVLDSKIELSNFISTQVFDNK